jgi:hypothetical protein
MAISFPSVTLQGNVLTFDSLEQIIAGKDAAEMPRQTARDYGFPNEEALTREIRRNWVDALDQYGIFKRQLERLEEGQTGTSETRSRWMLPFLSLLGYELRITNAQEIDGRRYAISHEVGNDNRNFPVHIVSARQSLNSSTKEGKRQSPHSLVQEYLNRHENLYALVSNGLFLRLLRDSSNLTKLSYVEFDLPRIFEERLFTDFSLLFRLLHLSRLPATPSDGEESILEKYHQEGLKSGSRIRDKLSEAVETGIEALGTGLMSDPANVALRDWAAGNPNAANDYYDALLKLIYRLLFIMVVEERDLIFPKLTEEEQEKMGADAGAVEELKSKGDRQRKIYYDYYALARLRRLATTYQLAGDRKYDLWDSLLNTFALFEDRGIGLKLGIEPLAGSLFNANALGPLQGCRVNNMVLLQSLRGLSQFDNEQGGVVVVNYASLDVEEFGSVYEGLLEYTPDLNEATRTFMFKKPEKDSKRSNDGAHYTPDELVHPLIKHSLEHLIAERTVLPDASQDKRDEARRQLLKLRVADVACGSGHILLAAARRIGLELARLEERAEQPSPHVLRRGVRDAIRHCIYGTDKNPLAVELCKVALWLEAHVPGEPLNFLDHRIRHGDAVLGVGRLEDLQRGIPTEAFQNYPGDSKDSKENGKNIRKRNKKERNQREEGGTQIGMFNALDTVEDQLAAFRQKYGDFAALPERTPAEIEAKAKAYKKITGGTNWWFIKTLADVQTAQFFLSLEKPDLLTSDGRFFEMLRGEHRQSQSAAAATGESANRHFFHWFLEFPEVFAQGGFDCVVGNPPFKGGQKISTEAGRDYLDYLHSNYEPAKGTTDLVAYFFRRIFSIVKEQGFQSLISTNTIAQGDTRLGGLAEIRDQGGHINHAVRSMKWPGAAAVEVSIVTIKKGDWKGKLFLNQEVVKQITTHLDDQEFIGDPFLLKENAGRSFVGSYVLGKGFILKPEDAENLIEKDPKNKDVLFPYLTGNDLNSRPDQSPSRWVINFFDWPERRLTEAEWKALPPNERNDITKRVAAEKTVEVAPPSYKKSVATDYLDCYEILERKVKSERQRWKTDKKTKEKIVGTYALRKPLPERWWMYGEKRPALYRTIAGMERVLVTGRVVKSLDFSDVSNDQVFSEQIVVIANRGVRSYLILNSVFHVEWSWQYSSRMGDTTLRYSGTDAFETYPFPKGDSFVKPVKLKKYRGELLHGIELGLTKLYNQFHNAHLLADYDEYWEEDVLVFDKNKLQKLHVPARSKSNNETYNLWRHLDKIEGAISMGEAVEHIEELRLLHKEMDEAILTAYGWDIDTRRWGPAIRLRHGFHEVDYLPEKDNVRYTIHPEARRKILKRLLLLNHEIHEAEKRGVDYAVIDGEKIEDLLLEQLEAWCPQAGQLHWKTRRFLCTGEDLLPGLERSLNKSFKPFVTQYASGMENELLEKIFVPWNAAFQHRFPLDDGSLKIYLEEQKALDPEKRRLDKFAGMLLKSNVKYTLGDMHFLLNMIYKPTGSTITKSSLLQDFRTFAISVYGEAVLDKDFLAQIASFVKSYRNEAAHTGVVGKEMAEACRDEVQGMVLVLVENEKPA